MLNLQRPAHAASTALLDEKYIVIKIAEVMSPNRTPLWDMVKQCGVNYVVGSFHGQSDRTSRAMTYLSYTSVMRMKTAYADGGFQMNVIESRPVDKAKLGLSDRDEEIEHACDLMRAMGSWALRSGATNGCQSSTGCASRQRRPWRRCRNRV